MMGFETKIVKVAFVDYQPEGSPLTRLAVADVQLPSLDMLIKDVVLTWCESTGYMALTPRVPSSCRVLHWRHDAPWCRDLTEKMKSAFVALGGDLPDADDEGWKRTIQYGAEREEVERAIA